MELFPNLFRLFKGSNGVVIYPDSQWFVPVKGSTFDMPISWVWGPPLSYRGEIRGSVLHSAPDFDSPLARAYINDLTEGNLFKEGSTAVNFLTKRLVGPIFLNNNAYDDNRLKLKKELWRGVRNRFKKKLDIDKIKNPQRKAMYEDLITYGRFDPDKALKLWLNYGYRRESCLYRDTLKIIKAPMSKEMRRQFRYRWIQTLKRELKHHNNNK